MASFTLTTDLESEVRFLFALTRHANIWRSAASSFATQCSTSLTTGIRQRWSLVQDRQRLRGHRMQSYEKTFLFTYPTAKATGLERSSGDRQYLRSCWSVVIHWPR